MVAKWEAVGAAVALAEREACAKIAEQHEEGPGGAEAIRMRSNALGNRRAAFGASVLTDELEGKGRSDAG